MTSSIDSLTGMPMPALHAAPGTGARPTAAAAASVTDKRGFDRLMNLQARGRELEAKLEAQAKRAIPTDPAATATAEQQAFYASELEQLRDLVGVAPGGNARRALAAIIERLEGGGELKPTDRLRIRLAIAADSKRVDVAGAAGARAAILSIDGIMDEQRKLMTDPTLIQDPARLAAARAQMAQSQEHLRQLDELILAGKVDRASLSAALAPRMRG